MRKTMIQKLLEAITGNDLDPIEVEYTYEEVNPTFMGICLPYKVTKRYVIKRTNKRTGEVTTYFENV